ncbi:MAG: hypothetical protein QXO37_06820 [Candidatus Nitrosocaldaceae archaeon]
MRLYELTRIFEIIRLNILNINGDMSGAELIIDGLIRVWRVSDRIYIYGIKDITWNYSMIVIGNTWDDTKFFSQAVNLAWASGDTLSKIRTDVKCLLVAGEFMNVQSLEAYRKEVARTYNEVFRGTIKEGNDSIKNTFDEFHELLRILKEINYSNKLRKLEYNENRIGLIVLKNIDLTTISIDIAKKKSILILDYKMNIDLQSTIQAQESYDEFLNVMKKKVEKFLQRHWCIFDKIELEDEIEADFLMDMDEINRLKDKFFALLWSKIEDDLITIKRLKGFARENAYKRIIYLANEYMIYAEGKLDKVLKDAIETLKRESVVRVASIKIMNTQGGAYFLIVKLMRDEKGKLYGIANITFISKP